MPTPEQQAISEAAGLTRDELRDLRALLTDLAKQVQAQASAPPVVVTKETPIRTTIGMVGAIVVLCLASIGYVGAAADNARLQANAHTDERLKNYPTRIELRDLLDTYFRDYRQDILQRIDERLKARP
jgi:hypothetical protein